MSTYIETLHRNGNEILPRTRTDAVYSPSNEALNVTLSKCIQTSDAIPSTNVPLNADTLDTHPASYFVPASSIGNVASLSYTVISTWT